MLEDARGNDSSTQDEMSMGMCLSLGSRRDRTPSQALSFRDVRVNPVEAIRAMEALSQLDVINSVKLGMLRSKSTRIQL